MNDESSESDVRPITPIEKPKEQQSLFSKNFKIRDITSQKNELP